MARPTFFVCLLVLVLSPALFAYGARVTVTLISGEKITGEILAVRGETLLVSKRIWLREESLERKLDGVCLIRKEDIQECVLLGESHAGEGIGMGLMAGLCVGILVNFKPKAELPFSGGLDSVEMNQPMLIVFPLLCAGLGAIAGIAASTKDVDVTRDLSKGLKYLMQFARYQDEVPEFLRGYFDKPRTTR